MLDTAHRAGRQACADAKSRGTNPHQPSEPEHEEWLRGWEAEYATLPDQLRAARDAKEANCYGR